MTDIKYKGAYKAGYDFAMSNDAWGFGEHSDEEDYKHIPKNIKDKKAWLEDWHFGYAVGRF